MQPLLRNSFKRFLLLGRQYPGDASAFKGKLRAAFQLNTSDSLEASLKKGDFRGTSLLVELLMYDNLP